MAVEDLVMRFMVDDKAVKPAVERIKAEIRGISGAISQSMGGFKTPMERFAKDFNKNTKPLKSMFTGDFAAGFTDVNADLKGLSTNVPKVVDGMKHMKSAVATTMGDFDRELKKNKHQFAGWAMSIMFFGMALKRIFTSIWKSGQKTFQDISHSVAGTVTGFDALSGTMTYLGFVTGQALEPIAEMLVPIMEWVADFVQNNPQLVAAITAIGIAFGTLFLAGGAMVLAINGFRELKTILTGIQGISFGSAMAWLSTPVGAGVTAALASLAIIGGLSWKAFSETPEAWEAIKDSIKVLEDPFNNFKKSLEELISDVLPGFKMDWETIAWTIAWAFDQVGGPALETFINSLTVMVEILAGTVDLIQMLGKAMTGDWTGALKEAGDWALNFSDEISAIKDTWKSAGELFDGKDNSISLEDYLANNMSKGDKTETNYYYLQYGDKTIEIDKDESAGDALRRLRVELGI